MRRIALFLLILCAALVAESRAPDRILGPLLFQEDMEEGEEGDEDAEEEKEPELTPPEDAPGGEATDEPGNCKVTLPVGWVVEAEGDEDGEVPTRMVVVRMIDGYDQPVAWMQFFRIRYGDPQIFTTMTPGEVLDDIEKRNKFFEGFYGEGSTGTVTPEMDGGKTLGDSDNGEGFEYNSIRPEEEAKIREAENLIRRGDKTVKVPEFKPIIVRGRLALISPYVYLVRWWSLRDLGEHVALNEEAEAILDSFEFFSSGASPPPLVFGGEGWRVDPKDTFENAGKKAVKTKRFMKFTGRKSHFMEVTYKLEPGFGSLEQKQLESISPNFGALIYAQDGDNNWVRIEVKGICIKEGTPRETIPQQVESWKTNWSGKAERTKIPKKPEKPRFGQASGAGYKLLTGKIGGFRATFTGVAWDKKGWRMMVEIETRGAAWDLYKKQILKVVKSLRFNSK